MQRDRRTDTQRETERERKTDRRRETHRERQMQTQSRRVGHVFTLPPQEGSEGPGSLGRCAVELGAGLQVPMSMWKHPTAGQSTLGRVPASQSSHFSGETYQAPTVQLAVTEMIIKKNLFSLTSLYSYRWRRRWHTTPVLSPGASHGRRSLVGCSPWGR